MKHGFLRCCHRLMEALPRFANRGLIEAGTVIVSVIVFGPLPRFANRGLIEARMAATSTGTIGRLPRFANRGLIEARG